MKCAIVGGTGWQGAGIATRVAAAGFSAIIGSRDPARAATLAANLPGFVGLPAERFSSALNEEAVAASDIVFVTVPSTGHRPVLEAIAPHVGQRLVIDVTAPVDPKNQLNEIWPEEGSCTAEAQAILGEDVDVVGGFKNVSATELLNHTMKAGSNILLVGDDLQAKHRVTLLCRDMGFTAYDAGKLEHARAVEAITRVLINLAYTYHLNQAGLSIVEMPHGMEILPDDSLFEPRT